MRIIFAVLFLCLISYRCKKEPKPDCPPLQNFPVDELARSFHFKTGSKWILRNVETGVIDTLKVERSDGIVNEFLGGNGHNDPCPLGNKETFHYTMSHRLSYSSLLSLDCDASSSGIGLSDMHGAYFLMSKNNVNDRSCSRDFCTKFEMFYSSLILQGDTFNNVFQMHYSKEPTMGISRIWWCPKVGFIKFELKKYQSEIAEIWELIDHSVQLH